MLKLTIRNLAKHIGKTEQALYYKRANHPKEFDILWRGWVEYCKEINKT